MDDRPDVVLRAVFPDPEDHYGSRWRMFRPHIAAMFQARDAKRLAENTQTQLRGRIRSVGWLGHAVLCRAAANVLGETWESFPSVSAAAAAAKAAGIPSALDNSVSAYDIEMPEYNVGAVKAALKKAAEKATKMGLTPVLFDVGESAAKTFKVGSDRQFTRFVSRVRIITPLLRHEGWSFIGTIQHPRGTLADNVVNVMEPGFDSVPWRAVPPLCEHCNLQRNRTDTYLVRHTSGEIKQVGKACLKEYTGIDPGSAAQALGIWAEIDKLLQEHDGDGDGEGMGGGRGTGTIYDEPTALLILATGMMIMRAGLGDSKDGFRASFGQYVSDLSRGKDPKMTIGPRDMEDAQLALLAVRKDRSSDVEYMGNLKAVLWSHKMRDMMQGASDEALSTFDVDFADRNTYLVLSWARVWWNRRPKKVMAQLAVQPPQGPPFIGTVGDRVRDLAASVVFSSVNRSQWGETYFHIAKTAADQVITFKNKDDFWLNAQPTPVLVTGTVEEHRTDPKGRPQTKLARASVLMPVGADNPYTMSPKEAFDDLIRDAYYKMESSGSDPRVRIHAQSLKVTQVPKAMLRMSLAQLEDGLAANDFVRRVDLVPNGVTWERATVVGVYLDSIAYESVTLSTGKQPLPVYVAVEVAPAEVYAEMGDLDRLLAVVAATKAARS